MAGSAAGPAATLTICNPAARASLACTAATGARALAGTLVRVGQGHLGGALNRGQQQLVAEATSLPQAFVQRAQVGRCAHEQGPLLLRLLLRGH